MAGEVDRDGLLERPGLGSKSSQVPAPDLEELIGPWPRRLLHIQSMRSYAWQPGNIYGGVKEPKYNAISYTWGRWALKENEKPDVTALQVYGTPWNIPRVNPQHFTMSDFHNILKNTAKTLEVVIDKRKTVTIESQSVDFIWVDVACIDQRFNRESMLEIGRQAEIFRNALRVYIWLSRTSSDQLDDFSCEVRDLSETAFRTLPEKLQGRTVYAAEAEGDFRPEWLDDGFRTLQSLHEDPWFTSLWTLQEAFLRKDACFLSKEGDFCSYLWELEYLEWAPEAGEDRRIFSLQEILDACGNVRVSIETNTMAKLFDEEARYPLDPKILEFFDSSGLNALSRNNPMELYAAAANRKPSRTLDSIYGIMQVSEFRLGESNQHAEGGVQYTLADLEDELGLALMKLSPVLSQSFRHAAWPREHGKNWRVSRQSTVPGRAFTDYMPWMPHVYTSDCRLDVQRRDSLLCGHFEGKLCAFSTLFNAWTYSNDVDTDSVPMWVDGESDMCIVLDIAPDLFPDLETPGDYNIRRGPMQYRFARMLKTEFRERVQVLHLGYYEPEVEQRRHFGLILLSHREETEPYWRRLGVCTWDISVQGPDPAIRSEPKIEWKPGWRSVYLERRPVLYEEEDYDELRSHWEDLAIQSGAWRQCSGSFG